MGRGPDGTVGGDRSETTRRGLLASAVGGLAAGLAGCIESSTDGQPSPQPSASAATPAVSTLEPTHTWIADPYTELDTPSREDADGDVTGAATLDAGFFTEYELVVQLPTQLGLTVSTDGAAMDVYLLDTGSFGRYRAEERVDFADAFAATGTTSVDESVPVSPGRYHVVFDNSSAYGSTPQGPVTFEFGIATRVQNPLTSATEPPTVVDSEGSQPKIRALEDNFGNEFRTTRDAFDGFHVEEEIVVTDETTIELCVTEIAAQSADNLAYRYEFLERNHPYNTGRYVAQNCWAWALGTDDYQSQWAFRLLLRNEDDIAYRGGGYDADFGVDVTYENLQLPE